MGLLDWFKQTWDNSAPDWLKQTANKASEGLSWLNEKVVQPGADWVKNNVGGPIGEIAGAIGQGANSVDEINKRVRKGDLDLGKIGKDIGNIAGAVGKGLGAYSGAKSQVKNKYNDVAGKVNSILPSSKRLKTY